MTTSAQRSLARAQIDLARQFGVGGSRWGVTREDSAGDTASVGTAQPLYVRQRKLSAIERALSQSATTQRTEWTAYWPETQSVSLEVGDVITSHADSALSFRLIGITATDRPGVTQATLEPMPFS